MDAVTRLAFVTPSFAPEVGGAETYTANLAASLGFEEGIDVIAAPRAGLPAVAEVPWGRVHRPGEPAGPGAGRALAFARSARRALQDLAPDLVLAQYSGLLPASRYARAAGRPLVALVHDLYGLRENVRWRGARGLIRHVGNDRLLPAARPDAVVAVSEATAASVRQVVGTPVVVARPGADHVPAGPAPATGSRSMLFVGRLVASKGVADLARAADRVRAEVPDVRLRVVGSGPEARRLPWWSEVESGLDDAALDRVYRASACLVFPSWREGWGLAITEAAARGLPYAAYDIPAVREQHEVVRGGVLVPAGDHEALAAAAVRLVGDPVHRRALGTRGQERARALLRWNDTAFAARCALALAADGRAEVRQRALR